MFLSLLHRQNRHTTILNPRVKMLEYNKNIFHSFPFSVPPTLLPAELRPHGGTGDARSGLLDVLISEDALRKFLLSASHAGSSASVQAVHAKQQQEHADAAERESDSDNEHQYSRTDVLAELGHRIDPAASSETVNSQCLHHDEHQLNAHDEEEDHEVHRTVASERFVQRTIPKHESARSEQGQL